jgi:tetratricopeptide (TPR) repeat protein
MAKASNRKKSASGMSKYPPAYVGIAETAGKQAAVKSRSKTIEIRAELDPELYAAALLATGQAHASAGNFKLALASLQRSLVFHLELYGDNHASVIDCRLHLAEALRRLANLGAAREMIEAALQSARANSGASSIQVGLVLNEWAALELHFNNLKAAVPAAEESLRRLTETQDPRRTLPMDTLARIHAARGQYAEARTLYLAMQPIDAATFLGTNHPRYVAHLHNHATVLQALGETTQAVKAFKKVAESVEKLYGDSYPDLPAVYANLGRLEQSRKKFDAAQEHYERARKLSKSLLGEKHPFFGYDLANLGRLALDRGDAKAAQDYLNQAVAIYRKAYDRPHTYLASALTFLAYARLELNKPEQARKAADEAVALWEEIADLCADRMGSAGACDRAFARVLNDAAQAACRAKGAGLQAVVCKESAMLNDKLQKGDIRRGLLAILVKRGWLNHYSPAAVAEGASLQQPGATAA